MADKKLTAEETRFWLKEVKSSLKRRDEELVKRNHYPFLIKYYEGNQHHKTNFRQHNTQWLAVINEYFPNINSLISEIMYQNPEITTEARLPGDAMNGEILKQALNYG